MARKNKPQHEQPASAGRRPRTRRLAAVARPGRRRRTAGRDSCPRRRDSEHGAAQPAGVRTRDDRNRTGQRGGRAGGRVLDPGPDAVSAERGPHPAHVSPARACRASPPPTGQAGQVAGAAAVESLRGPAGRAPVPAHSALPPRSGPTGSNWPGNFYLPPATTTGKVFFTTTGNGRTENWVCSASTVNSNGKDAVITAGHCVYGSLGGEVPGERWHSNWVFVPDYSNGSAPYGVWTARQLWTLTNYINNQDEGDDIGAAVMNTNPPASTSSTWSAGRASPGTRRKPVRLRLRLPGRGAVQRPVAAVLQRQRVQVALRVHTMELACNFTGGSSGGPWLRSFGGESGYINGVNDFGYSSLPSEIFSAYFGNNADALYNSVANL